MELADMIRNGLEEVSFSTKGKKFKVFHKGGKVTIEHTEKRMTTDEAMKVFKKAVGVILLEET